MSRLVLPPPAKLKFEVEVFGAFVSAKGNADLLGDACKGALMEWLEFSTFERGLEIGALISRSMQYYLNEAKRGGIMPVEFENSCERGLTIVRIKRNP